MSDYCVLCETRRPEGGTSIVVTDGGKQWIEFCKPCGDSVVMTSKTTGEQITPAQLFKRSGEAP
tara:strand:- start:949 stop:1140 length:192 start_codon:yes stop_codon:yes gene_type:complete